MVRLAICIPVYGPHLHYLRPLLEAIDREQTRRPDLVVVAASSVTTPAAATVLETLRLCSFGFPLQIVSTSQRRTAGANRNVAADAAVAAGADIDLLSFFDADDWMHPRRCEALVAAAVTGVPAGGFLHGTQIVERPALAAWSPPALADAELAPIVDCEEVYRQEVYSSFLKTHVAMARVDFPTLKHSMCLGHCTVKTTAWRHFGLRFEEEQTGLEDAAFAAALVLGGGGVACIDADLSLYVQDPAPVKFATKLVAAAHTQSEPTSPS